ncbi:hypothetical protein HPB51_015075 [Rhipicephalus microplus]|uniref:Uncharacterized protein n=1 Tax=Rhipicephalus microplus TaxID=6941 RepID=A0A9J6ET83_RHIMP|nr:hypothetical protein HPB51_015075 [Rhipicephalus microplus]
MATAAGVNGTVARFRFGIRDFSSGEPLSESSYNAPPPQITWRDTSERNLRSGGSRLMNPRPIGNEPYVPTELEHVANIITHALSILPSFFALKFLLQRAHTPAHMTAAVVYGIALVVLFVTSSLFHSVHFLGKLRTLKVILHRCDRAAIYIFIASAYTPWYKTLEVLIYIGSAVFPASATFSMRPLTGLKELLFGGLLYFIGVVFFKSDGRVPFAHAIWHLFVNAATLVHYHAVYRYLFRSGQVAQVAAAAVAAAHEHQD